MPLYDFRCTACQAVFEASLPVGKRPESCPECGGEEPQRMYGSVASFRGPALKGAAAQHSNDQRRVREEKRWEGFRAQREQLGLPPRGPSGE